MSCLVVWYINISISEKPAASIFNPEDGHSTFLKNVRKNVSEGRTTSIFYPEEERSRFLQNAGISFPNYTASHPRRL